MEDTQEWWEAQCRESSLDCTKYVEFEDRSLVMFSPELTCGEVVNLVRRKPISAGFVRFPDHGCGEFFGEAATLRLSADESLDITGKTFFGAVIGSNFSCRKLIVATDEDLVAALGLTGEPAPMRYIDSEVGQSALAPIPVEATADEAKGFAGMFNPGDC